MSKERQTTVKRRPGRFQDLLGLAASLSGREAVQLLAEAERRYQRDEIIIPVVGHFSAGKSTFVNTLLGEDVQDVGPQPTTGSFTEIRGGSPLSHELLSCARQVWAKIRAEFTRECSAGLDEEPGLLPTSLVRREYTSNPQWPRGLVLVDTPGLEAADKQYDAATWRYVENADACIYFITVTTPLTEADRQAIQQLAVMIPRILIVISKADMVDSGELQQVKHYVTETLAEWFGKAGTPPTVMAISCHQTAQTKERQADENSLAAWRVVTWIKEEVILRREQLRVNKLELDLHQAGKKIRDTLAARQQAEVNRCEAALAASIAKHEQAVREANRYRSMLAILDSRLVLLGRTRAQTLQADCHQSVDDILGSLKTWLSQEKVFDNQHLVAHVTHLLDTWVKDLYCRLAASLQAEALTLLKDFPCEVELPPVTIPDLNGRYKFPSDTPITVQTHTSGAPGALVGGLIGLALLGPLGAAIGALVGNSLASSERDWRSDLLKIVGGRLRSVTANLYNDLLQVVDNYIASVKSQIANVAAPVLAAETQTAEEVQAAQVELNRTKEYWMQKGAELNAAFNKAQALIHELHTSVQGGVIA
ncbi:MAG: dynamin family protein [Limnochordaceae bacterium]|nr:dynamin family protein [Limnochordaceae bacterium]